MIVESDRLLSLNISKSGSLITCLRRTHLNKMSSYEAQGPTGDGPSAGKRSRLSR